MNILYFTLDDFESVENYHSINADLLREFVRHGHYIYIVSPSERRKGKKTCVIKEGKAVFLKARIGNITKTNLIEKGISTLSIEPVLISVIKKYLNDVHFDLILYCTPPVTFCRAVEYVRKRDNARTYLLLKDIFPQNAVDIGILSTTGIKLPLYRYFRAREKKLYAISDTIGCMSPANVEYVLEHNPEVKQRNDEAGKSGRHPIVEVSPNSIETVDKSIDDDEQKRVRKKYGIPLNRTVFIYGGNLGKPQGIEFMLKCLHSQRRNKDVFFFIAGSGTEYWKIERYIEKYKPENIVLHSFFPKEEYDKVVAACDVGMIFLDHRFTIPNFPSRLLGYMTAKLPVLAVTDTATDVGKAITEGGFGWWCESDDVHKFNRTVKKACIELNKKMGENAFLTLKEKYDIEKIWRLLEMSLSE